MTKAAKEIDDRINYLCSLEETVFPEDWEEIETEINELASQICNECAGEGEIVKPYMPNNPNLIDVPYTTCPSCGGAGIV